MDYEDLAKKCFIVNNLFYCQNEDWRNLSEKERVDYVQIVKAVYKEVNNNSLASCADQNKTSE